jgi:MFS family permease
LFTPRFFVMCGFTFTVFLSAFQLLPTAPYRIQALGGSTFAAGLFLGLLTYASALSAPLTGVISDRIGRRRTLIIASVVILLCAGGYAMTSSYVVMLTLVIVHGVFWSGLLSASAAYLTNLLPDTRRAEGIGYWGMSSIAAIAVAPPIAFWIMQRGGWLWICGSCASLNVLMGIIAFALPDDTPLARQLTLPLGRVGWMPTWSRTLIEWRILALAFTLFLCSFGYGAITSFSAMYADAFHISPRSVYLTTLAIVILVTRPLSAPLADRIGYRRVLMPCLALVAIGLTTFAAGSTLATQLISAITFGAGFGTAYPVFVAHVLTDVSPVRRGAAFGAILAAFDTGIGTGSTIVGWLIEHIGFPAAFGVAAALSVCSLPYFVVAERRLR